MRKTAGSQSAPSNNINAVGGTGYSGNTSTANSDLGLQQNSTDTGAYATYQPGGSNAANKSFAYFSPSNEGQTTDSLYFDRLTPTASGTAPGTTLPGTFSVDSSGDLSYTVAAVPEPLTWASLFAAVCALAFVARRRSVARA